MRTAAEEGYTTATALADALVRRGVPFRAAHHIVGGLVGGAEAEGIATLAGLPDEAPKARVGFQEFGLPYAPDPGITRYAGPSPTSASWLSFTMSRIESDLPT